MNNTVLGTAGGGDAAAAPAAACYTPSVAAVLLGRAARSTPGSGMKYPMRTMAIMRRVMRTRCVMGQYSTQG
jgi:hypothetical protein